MLKISKTRDVETPRRGTPGSAGLDFFVPWDYAGQTTIRPGESLLVGSGIYASIPEGFALIAHNKSGIALNKNLRVGAHVVDEDYQGEILMHVTNVGNSVVEIKPGQALLQFLLIPVEYAQIEVVDKEDLYKKESARGEGGFNSTGLS